MDLTVMMKHQSITPSPESRERDLLSTFEPHRSAHLQRGYLTDFSDERQNGGVQKFEFLGLKTVF
jgi:hypothetical protein